jgi:hypothetical protein
VPGVLNDGVPSDRAGVTAFAARADTPLGTLGSLLTFGGIWKDAAAPAERDSVLLVLAALVLVLLSLFALIGTSWVRTTGTSGPGRPLTVRLATLATLSLLISGLPTTGPGSDLVGWLVVHVSGAGLWRDSQKLLAPFVLVAALGFAALLELVGRRLRDQGLGAATGALALVPIMLLPSLAWGLSGRFEPVTYPAEWHAVRAILEQQPVDQRRTMVLPWSAYQRLPWNGRRAALDPALRFFPGDVVTSDDLAVSDTRTVPGEDATAARIGAAIAHGEPLTAVLRSAGVRYVLVEKTASGAADVPSPAGIVLHDGPQLSLVDLGPGARPHHSVERAAILAADALTGVAFLGALVLLIRRRAGVRIGYHARGRSGNGGRAADYR